VLDEVDSHWPGIFKVTSHNVVATWFGRGMANFLGTKTSCAGGLPRANVLATKSLDSACSISIDAHRPIENHVITGANLTPTSYHVHKLEASKAAIDGMMLRSDTERHGILVASIDLQNVLWQRCKEPGSRY
jgi:hypothetical protein